ncbi:hypothetical protein [Archangium sp.]
MYRINPGPKVRWYDVDLPFYRHLVRHLRYEFPGA